MSLRWLLLVFLCAGLGCDSSTPTINPGDSAGDPGMGDPAMGDPAMGDPAMGDPAMGDAAMGDAAMGDAAMGDAAMGDAAMGDAAMGDAAMGDAAMGDAAMGDAAMGDAAMGCGPEPTPGSVIYVDVGAGAGGDGTSWGMAYNDLQDALGVVTSGQAIWVAAGTYYPVIPANPSSVTSLERLTTFSLPSGVALLGGFLPGDLAECDRDWSSNVTILSGDLTGDNADTNADDIIDMGLNNNSHHIVTTTATGPGTLIDGFTIQGAYAAAGGAGSYGGGVRHESGEVEVRNIRFLQNNSATFGAGGGMAVLDGTATVTDSTFEANFGDYTSGGGLYFDVDTEGLLERLTFVRNRGSGAGAGLLVNGATSVILRDSLFEDNHVTTNGGGLGNGGALALDNQGTLYVSGTHFIGNSGQAGGGAVHVRIGDLFMTHCVFAENSTGGSGGAISKGTGHAGIAYSIFTLNTAGSGGGAIFARGYLAMDHTTVAGNTSQGNGGAVFVILSGGTEGPVRFASSIVWGNNSVTGDDGVHTPATFAASRTILQGAEGSPWFVSQITQGRDGGGVQDVDPLFVDIGNPAGADGIYGTNDDGLRLQDGSPAIDIGLPSDHTDLDNDEDYREVLQDFVDANGDDNFEDALTLDLADAPRSYGRSVDLGAYENQTATFTSPAIVYVDAGAAPGGDGTTWGTAYDSLQDGLAAARYGDEMWVAAGTYIPGIDREDSFLLPPGVGIYGGFVGTETMRSDRDPDPAVNGTVLSGEIDTASDNDNIEHVVNASGVGPDTILDGFTITRGYVDPGGGNGSGAGMYMLMGSPTLQNLRFVDNHSGGVGGGVAIFSRSHPHLRHVSFINNDSGATAGGGLNTQDSHTVISDFYFTGNVAGGGGGISNNSSLFSGNPDALLFLSHGTFFNNDGSNNGSSPGPSGGGVQGISNQSKTYMSNVVFAMNNSVNGGAFGVFNTAEMHATHVTAYGNTATRGGAISAYNTGVVYLTNSILWGNSDTDNADQIYTGTSGSNGGDVFVRNCDVSLAAGDAVICGTCSIVDDGNNISVDPMFANTGDFNGADDIFGTPDDGLDITAGSMAINAGTTIDHYDIDRDGDTADVLSDIADYDEDGDFNEAIPADITGNARVVDTAPDMGAFEHVP